MWEASQEILCWDWVKINLAIAQAKESDQADRRGAPFTSLRRLSEKLDLDPHLKMIIDRYATYTGVIQGVHQQSY